MEEETNNQQPEFHQNAFIPNQEQNGLTAYMVETRELLEDVFNILDNRTLFDEETGNFLRAEEDEPLIKNPVTMGLTKLALRVCADKDMKTTLISEGTSEVISNGLIKRIQYMLLEGKDERMSQEQRSVFLYLLQMLMLGLLNKNVNWKFLEELNKGRSESVVRHEDTSKKGFSIPFFNKG